MSKWPIIPLRGHIAEVSERKGGQQLEILSVTNTNGFVRSLEAFDKQVFSEDASSYKVVRAGDLAYNPSRINVGSVACCQYQGGGAVSPMYVVVHCRPTIIPSYLLYFLKSDIGLQNIRHRCEGAVRFQLRYSDLERIELAIPPVAEQERIVRLLDEAAALRCLRAQADEKTVRLRSALFSAYFGEPIKNPRQWSTSTLGEHLALLEYGPRFYGEEYSAEGTRIVRITDLDAAGNLRFDDMPKLKVPEAVAVARQLHPGEVVFARSGATVGKVALVPAGAPACIAGAYFIRLRFGKTIDPVFGLELLRSAPIQELIKGQSKQAAQPNFSGPLIRTLPLIVPPAEQQRAFAAHIAEISAMKAVQTSSEQKLDDLFQSLLHHAFNGDL